MYVAFVWLFSTVRFQMCPQSACIRRCKVTLVAFIWLFSTVCFQMCPQVACLRGCKVTLVASVRLFTTVYSKMCFQRAWMRGCKVTLVTFVWLLFTVLQHMSFQSVCLRTFVWSFYIVRIGSHWIHKIGSALLFNMLIHQQLLLSEEKSIYDNKKKLHREDKRESDLFE